MPSRRGKEQAMIWLQSKMAEGATLDAINAEVCYNVIMDLEKRRKAIGAMYHLTKVNNRSMKEQLDDLMHEKSAAATITGYMVGGEER